MTGRCWIWYNPKFGNHVYGDTALTCSAFHFRPSAESKFTGSREDDKGETMKNRLLLIAAVLALFSTLGQAQAKKTKAAETAPAVSIPDLVLKGKIDDAVKFAVKTPLAAESAFNSLMASADTQIVLRKIPDAQATLDAAQKFMDACDKTGRVKDLPKAALKGRQLRLQGIVLSNNLDFTKALEVLNQALLVSKSAKDLALEAGIHNNLGYARQKVDSLDEAAHEFDTARKIAEDQKDDLRAGSYNFNLGTALLDEEKFDAALAAFQRSAEQNKRAAQAGREARAIFMQARVITKIDPKKAEIMPLFQDAATRFEKLEDPANAGWSYFLMGDNARTNGDFKKAADLAEKALPFLTKAGDKLALQECYRHLALMYTTLGETAKAEKYDKLANETAVKK
jgi:tetratricopeptide (TPR) repeat protein